MEELKADRCGKYTMRSTLGNIATSIEPNEVALLKQRLEQQVATIARLCKALRSLLADITALDRPECSNPEAWEVRLRAVGVSAKEATDALKVEP